jgi:hypothetical protein
MTSAEASLPRVAVRLLGWTVLGLLVLFTAETAIDLAATGVSLGELTIDPRQAQALASTVSRAFNNLMTMVLAFIALAIPITANMYTPRLIEIFVSDRVNLAALLFFAGMGAHAVFAQTMAFEQWAPRVQFTVTAVSGLVGFAILIPYYLYVLSFLDPDTIIDRVTRRLVQEFERVRKGRPSTTAKRRVERRILHLGNVVLRAVERADRDVALAAIRAFEHSLRAYEPLKDEAAAAWFEVDRELFVGLSDDAVALLERERNWVEHKALGQVLLAYNATLTRMPDAVSAISKLTRDVAAHASQRGDTAVLDLCVRCFNTFLRAAVRRRDVHAIYDVFHQYKLLARSLLDKRPGRALVVAQHFKYYAEFARFERLPFVYELVAYELGAIVEWAYEAESRTRREVLDVFLTFRGQQAQVRLATACALVAGYFADSQRTEELALVTAQLEALPPELLESARRHVLEATDPVFWEVTDRQRNLDYVEPGRRATVARLLEEVVARRRGALPQA